MQRIALDTRQLQCKIQRKITPIDQLHFCLVKVVKYAKK